MDESAGDADERLLSEVSSRLGIPGEDACEPERFGIVSDVEHVQSGLPLLDMSVRGCFHHDTHIGASVPRNVPRPTNLFFRASAGPSLDS
jgi:hypothetical protein